MFNYWIYANHHEVEFGVFKYWILVVLMM